VYGQIRSLAGAVNREKTQTGYVNAVKMVIGVTNKFTSLFCFCLGRDGEIYIIILGKRHFFIVAIDTGA
jgi:hypothetical protein